jgi:hypothetical protein
MEVGLISVFLCTQLNNVSVRNRDFMREAPPTDWLEAQEQRLADEQRQKLQRVQRELRLIEEIKIKGERAQEQHRKVRRDVEANDRRLSEVFNEQSYPHNTALHALVFFSGLREINGINYWAEV